MANANAETRVLRFKSIKLKSARAGMVVKKSTIDEYILAPKDLVDGRVDLSSFVENYLNKFKNEKDAIGGRLYAEMQALFDDANSVTDDKVLISEYPDFYISEEDFKEKIPGYLSRISLLGMNR